MENNTNAFPTLRFKEFRSSWKRMPLNQLLYEAKQRNYKLKYDKSQVLSVSKQFGVVNQIKHLGRSYAGESVHNYHVLEVGDIVYTKSPLKENPYGVIKINKGKPGIVSTLYAVYKVNGNTADGTFLDFYFSLDANTNRYLRPLVKKGAKNDMKINNAYVLNDPIYVPQKKEQKKIATFLTAIDDKIQQLISKKALLEKYKKGASQQLFAREIRFKDGNGKEFPDWQEMKLEDLITIKYGKDQKAIIRSQGAYPILGTGGEIGRTNDFLYNKPSVLIGRKGTIDNPKYMDTPFWTVDTLFYTEVHENCIAKWLYHRFTIINWYLYNEASGVPSLSASTIYKITIQLPSLKEQQKIGDFLSSIDNKIDLVNQQLQQAQIFKKGLIQQMFI
ncbi:restriction endonuclease subunit S [Mucilaginibacter sp. HMF5004]|uniref:restriction endonuclease subunit S n=1 Tax=Mucilaginibacter rivuli TaxID=2857527 RepID=UPI001C5FA04B|nr:restriction endonuclease subunit S [Mucilaginibacter rivuli]MBW4888108.1 restriction endonuclease subunit S [Mucilaginibacter rivuli]